MITAVVAAVVAGAGVTAYTSANERASAKDAANKQKELGLAQIEAGERASKLATEQSKAKLKQRQAAKTDTILTSPFGVDSEQTTQKSMGAE